jgi:hypothetical protein
MQDRLVVVAAKAGDDIAETAQVSAVVGALDAQSRSPRNRLGPSLPQGRELHGVLSRQSVPRTSVHMRTDVGFDLRSRH